MRVPNGFINGYITDATLASKLPKTYTQLSRERPTSTQLGSNGLLGSQTKTTLSPTLAPLRLGNRILCPSLGLQNTQEEPSHSVTNTAY